MAMAMAMAMGGGEIGLAFGLSILPRLPLPRSCFPARPAKSLCTPLRFQFCTPQERRWEQSGVFKLDTCPERATVAMRASDGSGPVAEDDLRDTKILPYCNIDRKSDKRSLGDLEQDFLEALQSFYYDKKPIMSNEEFDNLKEELIWEGSDVVILSSDEQKFMEASLAYAIGRPILSDTEYDALKLKLKKTGSKVALEGPRCSLRSKKVYSDCSVDYLKMFLLNVPAALVALTLVFFLDDLTGFEITYLLEMPEPYSFLFTWFVVLPVTYLIAQSITNAILKDFLILKGPCPICGAQNNSFFGTILTVPSGSDTNDVTCQECTSILKFDMNTRLITLETTPEEKKSKKAKI